MSSEDTAEVKSAEAETPRPRRSLRIALALLPLVIFVGIAATFFVQLTSGEDASEVPSALIGKPAPEFELPPIVGLTENGSQVPGLSTASLKGHLTLVNVWASWCVPCREEQPLLMQLSKDDRFRLVGINYKDKPENALEFLNKYGNPFAVIGADRSGRVGIDWGVYGVPETYLVGPDGTILFKQVGPFTPEAISTRLMPAIEAALAAHPTVTSSAGSPS